MGEIVPLGNGQWVRADYLAEQTPGPATGGDPALMQAIATGQLPEGHPLEQQLGAQRETFNPQPKPKKKGKKSEFFQLLRKMDAEEAEGKTDTRKAMKALLKQMNAEGSVSPT